MKTRFTTYENTSGFFSVPYAKMMIYGKYPRKKVINVSLPILPKGVSHIVN